LRAQVTLLRDESVTIAANHREIVPCIICGIAVDVVFFDRLARLVANAARVPVRYHESVFDFDRDVPPAFQSKKDTVFLQRRKLSSLAG